MSEASSPLTSVHPSPSGNQAPPHSLGAPRPFSRHAEALATGVAALLLAGPASVSAQGLVPRATLELPVIATAGVEAAPEVAGDLLLVPLASSGLAIYDISNPGRPAEIATVPMSEVGGQVGAATTDGSRVFVDLADQLQLAVLDLDADPVVRLGTFGSIDWTLDLAMVGGTLLANAGATFDHLGGIYAFDTAPSVPVASGDYLVDLVDPGFLSNADGVALIARTPGGPSSAAGFDAVDMSDPANPAYLGSWASATPGNITGMAREGDRLFLSAFWGGLWVVDISDFSNMQSLTAFDFEQPESYALDVEAWGSLVLLLQGGPAGFPNQVNVYSISQGHAFTLLDTVPLGNAPGFIARSGSTVAVDEYLDKDGDGFTDHRLIRLYSLTTAFFWDGFESGDLTGWGG